MQQTQTMDAVSEKESEEGLTAFVMNVHEVRRSELVCFAGKTVKVLPQSMLSTKLGARVDFEAKDYPGKYSILTKFLKMDPRTQEKLGLMPPTK